jgi:hypothetical protein
MKAIIPCGGRRKKYLILKSGACLSWGTGHFLKKLKDTDAEKKGEISWVVLVYISTGQFQVFQ